MDTLFIKSPCLAHSPDLPFVFRFYKAFLDLLFDEYKGDPPKGVYDFMQTIAWKIFNRDSDEVCLEDLCIPPRFYIVRLWSTPERTRICQLFAEAVQCDPLIEERLGEIFRKLTRPNSEVTPANIKDVI